MSARGDLQKMTFRQARIWRLEQEVKNLHTRIETLELALLKKTISNPDFDRPLSDLTFSSNEEYKDRSVSFEYANSWSDAEDRVYRAESKALGDEIIKNIVKHE